jgi:hypothetical protein
MSSLTAAGAGAPRDGAPQPAQHACADCGATPNSARAGCVHRGAWHSSLTDCSPRCAWKLGRSRQLGACHYSCCFSTDQNEPQCAANPTHSYAPSAPPSRQQQPLFGVRDCPRYVVDLDAPASERWAHVVKDYVSLLPSVVSMAEDILGTGVVASLTTGLFATAARMGRVHYGEEIQGIAKTTGVPLGRVVLLQIAYEAFAACTSIVVDGPDGHPLHIRTMDWEMPELQPLTIEVDFVKGGTLVHRATTWAGYVGVLTGLRADGFSVSVNYRRTKMGDENGVAGVLQNLKRGLAGHWPVSFLVREVMETETEYQQAVDALRMSELMAPVYLTIAGTRKGEGIVLARDREAVEVGTPMEADPAVSETLAAVTAGGTKAGGVVQANMDIFMCDRDEDEDDWQDICDSRTRRGFAKAALASGGSGAGGVITMRDLWGLMSFAPCKAHDTVYTVAMVPKTSELVTRVRPTRAQRQAGKKRWKHVRVAAGGRQPRAGSGATRQ